MPVRKTKQTIDRKFGVFRQNITEHTNTPRVQNAEFIYVTAAGTYIYHYVLKFQDNS